MSKYLSSLVNLVTRQTTGVTAAINANMAAILAAFERVAADMEVMPTPANTRRQIATAFTAIASSSDFVMTPTPALGAIEQATRFRVKFSGGQQSSSYTLSVSGLPAKALKQYDSSGAKIDAVIADGQLADVEYDGADWVILDPLPTVVSSKIMGIQASAASNILTLSIGGAALDFRSTNLASGVINTRATAGASISIPVGATLGTVNLQPARLILLAIDNVGTIELAICNLAGGINLDETSLISTTAMSASATAANVIYSATARTNVPFRVVGFIDSTQATAGTWATTPSKVQGCGGQALAAMSSLGYGQTWTDVKAGRAFNTTYYNTSGKPRILKFTGTNDVASTWALISIVVDGKTIGVSRALTSASSHCFDVLIPPYLSYSLVASGTATTIASWYEF